MSTPTCTAVLVVEDDEAIRRQVVALLVSEGFQAYEAANQQEALVVLPQMPHPALILADLIVPMASEPWLVALLSEGDCVATLPVVLVSSDDRSAPHTKQPIDPSDLVRIVSQLCLRRT